MGINKKIFRVFSSFQFSEPEYPSCFTHYPSGNVSTLPITHFHPIFSEDLKITTGGDFTKFKTRIILKGSVRPNFTFKSLSDTIFGHFKIITIFENFHFFLASLVQKPCSIVQTPLTSTSLAIKSKNLGVASSLEVK